MMNNEEIVKTNNKIIEFDPSSNKPFMIYFKDKDGEFQSYSGENTLKIAKQIGKRF